MDRTLYLTVGNKLVALDSVDGGDVWSYTFSDAFNQPYTTPRTAPTMDDDGIAYIGTDHGIAAVVVGSNLADTPWPKVHGNPQNSGRRMRFAPIVYDPYKAQTRVNNGSGSLRVRVTGNPAPTLQWYLDGRQLLNATNSEVDLAMTSLANGGSLTVVARNSVGSTESKPIYLFGEDQLAVRVMGLRLTAVEASSVLIERSTSLEGPWTSAHMIENLKDSQVWSDLDELRYSSQFYRCRDSKPIQVLPDALNALRVVAPVGDSRIIEYVDAQTGWTNWQHLTNVTIQTSPMWILDQTPNPPNPRYYRVVPR